MKTILVLGAIFVLGMFSACTFQMGLATAGKGRVIIAATTAQKGVKARIAKPAHVSGARSVGVAMRSASSVQARDLAAATDITSMTYSLFDMDNNGAAAGTGPIDKTNPSLDLTLNPGTNYRIVVDVVITTTAPGYSVGVTHYGDQADFLVDPNYDTYVSLTIHPTQAVVFDPASVPGNSANTIKAYDPVAQTSSTLSLFNGPLIVSPADRLFLGPDARLYYFNQNANTVFWWPAIGTVASPKPIPTLPANAVLTGTLLSSLASLTSLSILAACADPVTADALWVVAEDASFHYYYFEVTAVSSSPAISDTYEITGDLTASTVSNTTIGPNNTVVVTGVAVDSTYSDVYVAYANTNGTALVSGILEYYYDAKEPYSLQPAFANSASSIYTDVVWEEGKLWALLSPNTTFGGNATLHNLGTADLQAFDDFLTAVTGPKATVSNNSWTGNPAVTTSGTTLGLPNRFTGPIQGSVLYLDQWDFMGTGTEKLTSVNLDATSNALTFY